MSTLKEKVLALFAAEETPPAPPVPPVEPPAPPVTPPETPPVTPPPVEPPVTPPELTIQETIDEALRIQKAEMEAGFKEKLKGITSNTTPPPVVPVEPTPPAEGVDFKRWNDEVSKISKRIANQN